MAAFSEADQFIIDGFSQSEAVTNFKVIVQDSQSNPNRVAEVGKELAKELIVEDEIDMMLVALTPETTNPAATTCEAEGIPVISTVVPWQPYFIGQQGKPGKPGSLRSFDFSSHFFWGLEDVISTFTSMWDQLETNKSAGAILPNDGDGNTWDDPNVGYPPVLNAQGYMLTDTGRYQDLTDDFSAQVKSSKRSLPRGLRWLI